MKWLFKKIKSFLIKRKENKVKRDLLELHDKMFEIKTLYESRNIIREEDLILLRTLLIKTPIRPSVDFFRGRLDKVSLYTKNCTGAIELVSKGMFNKTQLVNSNLINYERTEDYLSYWLTKDIESFCELVTNSLNVISNIKDENKGKEDLSDLDIEFLSSNLFRFIVIDYIVLMLLYLGEKYEGS